MHPDDEVRLRHIQDAAQKALTFLDGKDLDDLTDDDPLYHALIRLLSVIGEAANHVSNVTQGEIDIEWSKIIAMRHRLMHGYFAVNRAIVYETVMSDLPPTLERIEEWYLRQERR